MKNKNILCFVLCLAVAFSCICTTGFALSPVTLTANNVIIYDNQSEFSVPVVISGNTGIAAMGFKVSYNSQLFKLVSVDTGVVFEDDDFTEGDFSKVPYSVSCVNATADNTKNGTLVTLNFDVVSSPNEGNYEITISDAEAFSLDETEVDLTVQNSKITVKAAQTEEEYVSVSSTAIEVANGTQTVQAKINIDKNPGIAIIGFKVDYNSNYFELTDVAEARFANTLPLTLGDLTKDPYSVLAYNDSKNATNTGHFLTLTFNVKAGCPAGTYFVKLLNGEAFSFDEEPVRVKLVNNSGAGGGASQGSDITVSDVNIGTNSVSFTAELPAETVQTSAKITAVMYDASGKAIQVELDQAKEEVDFEFNQKGSYVKVFVMSTKNLKPLSKPLYYSID